MANEATRRSLLGAMALAPAIIAAPAVAATPSTAWDQAMAHFLAVKARHGIAWTRFTRLPAAESDALSAEMEALTDDYCAAEDLLMEMPAPDARALQWKMQHVLETQRDGCTPSWRADYVKPLLDDIARLAGRA